MFELIYSLFIVCCLLGISLSGLMIAAAMWRKSNSLCDECRKELDK